jgi:hypothetical protein
MVERAPAPAAASPDQLGRSRLRTAPLHPELTNYRYNERRPHQSREQRPPLYDPGEAVDVTARIERTQVVQGLISEYRRAA